MLSANTSSEVLVGYARVSTEEQLLDLQLNALRAAGCCSIYQEKVSGASKKRPQLDLAIKELQPGDTLVVWRLDRLARSNEQVYRRMSEIRAAGATFRSLTENIGFDTAVGQFMMTMLAGLAQMERDTTIERTRAGMEAARLRGSQIGATVKFTPEKQKQARAMFKAGAKASVVAKRLRLSVGTVSKVKPKAQKRTRSIAAAPRSFPPANSTKQR